MSATDLTVLDSQTLDGTTGTPRIVARSWKGGELIIYAIGDEYIARNLR